MYVHITSTECQLFYPDNTSTEFTVELPVPITKSSQVGLTQVYFKGEAFCVLSTDICEESILNCSLRPVLATFCKSGDIVNPVYKPVTLDWIKRIRFSLQSSEKIEDFKFTLHFKEI